MPEQEVAEEALAGGVEQDPNPLLALLRGCVVRIDCDGEFRGTGFFVGPGRLLTCAHVVHGAKQIVVSGPGWQAAAEALAWAPGLDEDSPEAAFYPFPDVALLRAHGSPDGQPSVRIGLETPVAGEEPDLLWLLGFSKDAYKAGKVERDGASVSFEGVFGEHGLFKLEDGQVVRGFSGSPLLNMRTGLVCGLMDSSRSVTDDLGGFAVPMSAAAAALPGLVDCNEAAHNGDGTWESAVLDERTALARRKGEAEALPILPPPYELDPEAEYAPSELLKPRYAAVELLDRETLQAQLMRWRESERSLSALLLTGGGGTGKTRLALEECARAADAGWTAGLFTLDTIEDAATALDRLVAWPGRLFLAIDYAETRPSLVGPLIRRLARRSAGPPARLVLICRQGDGRRELEDLFSTGDDRETIAGVLRRAEPVALGGDGFLLDGHRLFRAGVRAFAQRLGGDAAEPPPRVSLEQPHFARPLFVLAAALLRAEDPTADVDALGRDDLMLELIDQHERQYWTRWNKSLGVGLDPSLHARAVAVATMLGASGEEEALAAVGAVPDFAEALPERRREIARWLSHLYGSGNLDRSPSISPIEPDMLAEALVTRECLAHPELIGIALDVDSERQLGRALAILTRASEGSEQLARRAGAALDDRLPKLVVRAGEAGARSDLTAALDAAVRSLRPLLNAHQAAAVAERFGPLLSGLTLKLQTLAVEHAQASTGSEFERRSLAAVSLSNLASTLSAAGRGREALVRAVEAVDCYRAMAEDERARCLPGFAHALTTLGGILGGLRRSEEALAAIIEAVGYQRELAERVESADPPGLAMALVALAGALGDLGRNKEAIGPIEEAVGLYMELVKATGQEQYARDVALSLSNLSIVLGDLGRDEEAIRAIGDAVAILRTLSEGDRDRNMPDLALFLVNLSASLGALGRDREGFEVGAEATEYYRVLVEADPTLYLPQLALLLTNQSNRLANLGRREEAVMAAEESVKRYRELVAEDSDRHLPDLARSLNNLGARASELGVGYEALEAIGEAVQHYRELSEKARAKYLPSLARSLNNFGSAQGQLGGIQQAPEALGESVTYYRDLVAEDRGPYLPEFAAALGNLGSALARAGRREEALVASAEAVEHYRELVAENRALHLRRFAHFLLGLSESLREEGKLEESAEIAAEAVDCHRELVGGDDDRHRQGLAASLNSLAASRRALGEAEEALEALREAVECARGLAKQDPDRYLPDLAEHLSEMAVSLTRLGRGEEAEKAIGTAIADFAEQPVGGLLLLLRARRLASSGNLALAVADGWAAHGRVGACRSNEPSAQVRAFLRSLRVADAAEFDVAWADATAEEQPAWLRHPELDPSLGKLVVDWLAVPSLDASREFLESNAETLLADSAEAAFAHLIDLNSDDGALENHLALVRAARKEGVEPLYAALVERSAEERRRLLVSEWLSQPGHDRRHAKAFLAEHEAELLDPRSEYDLLQFALANPDRAGLFAHPALLGMARIEGPDAAYELLEGALPPQGDDASEMVAKDDSRTLHLARLRLSLEAGSAERHFHHALAAAAAGQEEEAAHAIGRCRAALSSWEVPDYQRRLEQLRPQPLEVDEALATLVQLLSNPS